MKYYKQRINPVIISASQRCLRWWLWGSELRVRSPSLGPKWWAAPTSQPKLLWVRRKAQNKHSGASRPSSVRPSPASRCWWRPCLRWGLSADGPLATSTPLRMKWQQLWPREVRVCLCVCACVRTCEWVCVLLVSTPVVSPSRFDHAVLFQVFVSPCIKHTVAF